MCLYTHTQYNIYETHITFKTESDYFLMTRTIRRIDQQGNGRRAKNQTK